MNSIEAWEPPHKERWSARKGIGESVNPVGLQPWPYLLHQDSKLVTEQNLGEWDEKKQLVLLKKASLKVEPIIYLPFYSLDWMNVN